MRKNHYANLESLKSKYASEKERKEKMEEEDRLRMRALREGKIPTTATGVVRVLKKEKNLEEDYAAAQAVKEQSNSKRLRT